MVTGRKAFSRKPLGTGFVGSAVRWFLGLSGLYVLYASGTFFGLDEDFRMANRLGMALGSATPALSLLVASASFAAAARSPTFERRDRDTVGKQVMQLMLLAVGAYALYGLGPRLSSDLLYLDSYPPPEVVANSRIVESARFWVPSAIAIFTILSGVAGRLTSRVTEWWHPGRRIAVTWLCCLGLLLSFWLPFLLTTNLMVHREIAPAWILPGSLILPTILIAGLAWRLADDLGLSGAFQRLRSSDSHDPHHIDRVDRAVNPPVRGPDEPPTRAVAATRAELEMIHLAKGIRSVVGPSANLSPQRVDEIVNALLEAPQPKAAKPSVPQRARDRIGRLATVGQFCTNWACLAAVLLMVGMLGGVPPNLVLAGLAGLLGSVVIRTTADWKLSIAR
ncbi:MAG: hypothetical protein OXH49_08215 [Gemmatimonadetes bacterium]|nr:hypothetical protein [Gemmatimonadota bacterium]